MLFYDETVIPECDSSHSLSVYCLPYLNLIRHNTNRWKVGSQLKEYNGETADSRLAASIRHLSNHSEVSCKGCKLIIKI